MGFLWITESHSISANPLCGAQDLPPTVKVEDAGPSLYATLAGNECEYAERFHCY